VANVLGFDGFEDGCNVQENCVVGALTFVPTNMDVPPRSMVVGSPAKLVKSVSDEMIAWKTEGTRLYQALPKQLHATLTPCEPLRTVPADREQQQMSYRTWHETRQS
jgi:phenylacetic acid degradation protein